MIMILLSGAAVLSGCAGADKNTAADNPSVKEDVTANTDSNADEIRLTVKDSEDITIDSAGKYVITGTAAESEILIDADKKDEVQLVLDGLSITNKNRPCIYVKKADKVLIKIAEGKSDLAVTGDFSKDGKTNTDAVIFSKDDLTIDGPGELSISSTDNGISGKDSVRITGGTIGITCTGCAIEAHDAIEISDGTIAIYECHDGLHADKESDETVGYIYISGGYININAIDDAIHATTDIKIDAGDIVLSGAEGIEGTVIMINGGNIDITATGDGINAAHKSDNTVPLYEQNNGSVTIRMSEGDTDGLDSNGDIVMNGGTLNITGPLTFDCDGKAIYNGGIIIENGKETNAKTMR
jgi:hypothetical protein